MMSPTFRRLPTARDAWGHNITGGTVVIVNYWDSEAGMLTQGPYRVTAITSPNGSVIAQCCVDGVYERLALNPIYIDDETIDGWEAIIIATTQKHLTLGDRFKAQVFVLSPESLKGFS